MIASGAMAHMMIQVILNIAVVTNTIPNTGITLPFISYGGTSVMFLLFEMGLVLNVSSLKKHHAYALIVLILAAAIIILGTVLLFYIQEVEVSGNEYCDSQEIVECVQNDKLSKNSLYVLAKYSLGQGKKPKCLDTLKVSMKNPWTLKITVKEKTRVGCVKSGKKYSYFDQTKLVVNETGCQWIKNKEK